MSAIYPAYDPARQLRGDLDDLYRYLVEYLRDHDGAAPTLRRIVADTLISSTSMVERGLRELELAGRIERRQMVAGGIRLARPPRCACCGGIDYARILAELEQQQREAA